MSAENAGRVGQLEAAETEEHVGSAGRARTEPQVTAGSAAAAGLLHGERSTDPEKPAHPGWTALGVVVVVGLALLVTFLSDWVPEVSEGTGFGELAKSVEFPVYAIALGFLGNAVLSLLGIRDRMSAAYRTELFIKTGLVLLGATVNFNVIARAAGPAVAQAFFLIAIVFLFTWWFAGRLGIDRHLRALLASALSICGVSAAVAAAGAVRAKKEQLAYTAGLVILFALPSIFLMPALAGWLGLSPAVTGAWIGGNIDTTAAVTAAGQLAGEQPLQIAAIVKTTQNALLGVVAILLSLYFTLKVERATAGKVSWGTIWDRFPKFVLGFLIASALVTALSVDPATAAAIKPGLETAKTLQTLFLTLAFVSIGLEFQAGALKQAGWRPILVFFVGTVVNLLVGLGLAVIFFGGFEF